MKNNTQLVIKMYKNNISIAKIASVLGEKELTIYNILFENNIDDLQKDKTYERNQLICAKFKNNEKITDIANDLKLERHTVSSVLDKFFPDRIKRNLSNLSKEKSERNNKIVLLYKQGKSISEISNIVKINRSTIYKILKDFKTLMRSQHQIGHSKNTTKNRKYNFNLNYFENIDSEEKAYWLGFLYADGYISYKGYIRIALQEQDLDHIKKFRTAIDANEIEIKYVKKTKSYKIDCCSIKMIRDLTKLGCCQNKSLILKFPTIDQVPINLINHFMRGYFDGDGCISFSNNTPSFSILGTKNFLNKYEDVLIQHTGYKKKNKRIHNDSWNENTEAIVYSGKKIEQIYNFLYNNANIYLERKYTKFNKIISRLKTNTMKS